MTGTADTYDDLMPQTNLATLRQHVGLTAGTLLTVAGVGAYAVATLPVAAEALPMVAEVPNLLTVSLLMFGLGAGLFAMMVNNIAGVVTVSTLWKVSSVYVPLVLLYATASMAPIEGFDAQVTFVHLCFMCGSGVLWAFWRTRSLNPLSGSL